VPEVTVHERTLARLPPNGVSLRIILVATTLAAALHVRN
jgi:hypothetical protein